MKDPLSVYSRFLIHRRRKKAGGVLSSLFFEDIVELVVDSVEWWFNLARTAVNSTTHDAGCLHIETTRFQLETNRRKTKDIDRRERGLSKPCGCLTIAQHS